LANVDSNKDSHMMTPKRRHYHCHCLVTAKPNSQTAWCLRISRTISLRTAQRLFAIRW